MKQQPFASPGEALEHHGVKGMRWGVRKEEETSDREPAQKDASGKLQSAPARSTDMPGFEERVQRLSRTDRPQTLGTPDRVTSISRQEAPKQGLTREQKMLLTFGAVAAAGAGYYAYTHYVGGKPPKLSDFDLELQQVQKLDRVTLPAHWDVSHLKNGPISTKPLGMLGHGIDGAAFDDIESLVVNTSRGYADFLPKDGFSNPFAKTQHDSMVRVLEEMREKYPSIRNMNIELAPMSAFSAVGGDAQACVLPMGPGEARLFYNDMVSAPTQTILRQNKSFLPGLGAKDYVAYHEIGHLFAVAHGELPPAKEFLGLKPDMKVWKTREFAEPLLHRKMFAKHGFTFKELSKISGYASTQPAESMAELVGHYFQPEMRKKLTPDQLRRAEAMINEMGGLA